MPIQKFGTATPIWLKTRTARSTARSRFAAAATPSGRAIAVEIRIAMRLNGIVTASLSATSVETGMR